MQLRMRYLYPKISFAFYQIKDHYTFTLMI